MGGFFRSLGHISLQVSLDGHMIEVARTEIVLDIPVDGCATLYARSLMITQESPSVI
jgi:hypothetical protein